MFHLSTYLLNFFVYLFLTKTIDGIKEVLRFYMTEEEYDKFIPLQKEYVRDAYKKFYSTHKSDFDKLQKMIDAVPETSEEKAKMNALVICSKCMQTLMKKIKTPLPEILSPLLASSAPQQVEPCAIKTNQSSLKMNEQMMPLFLFKFF